MASPRAGPCGERGPGDRGRAEAAPGPRGPAAPEAVLAGCQREIADDTLVGSWLNLQFVWA